MMTHTYGWMQRIAVAAVAGVALLTANSVASAQETEICVLKFYDANANGEFDDGEVEIAGWRVALVAPDGEVTEGETGEDGTVCFVVPSDGQEYLVFEIFPEGDWVSTTPSEVVVTAADGEDAVIEVDFGNVCLGAGEGDARSKGFWGNRNGQALVTDEDLATLNALGLVDDDGEPVVLETAGDLARFLKDARATNMAYMLSAQLAATVLNVEHEFVSLDDEVYAPGVFEDSNVATIGELIDAAVASLATDPLTLPGSEERAYQEAIKDALDAANNNAATIQAEPCEFEYPVEDDGEDDNGDDEGNGEEEDLD
jgi:hypothetical protein